MVKMADCSDGIDSNLDGESLKDDLTKAKTHPLVDGDKWYLVPKEWMNKWENYVNQGGEDPGCIDLSSLLDENDKEELKPHLQDELDFFLIPENYWRKLEKRHSLKEGQKPIERKVVTQGSIRRIRKVEVYLTSVELIKDFDQNTKKKIKVSVLEKLCNIRNMAKRIFKVNRDTPTQLWQQQPLETQYTRVRDSGDTEDSEIIPGTIFVLEAQNDGKWPSDENSNSRKTDTYSEMGNGSDKAYLRNVDKWPTKPVTPFPSSSYASHPTSRNHVTNSNNIRGVCGLHNVGNTCFMNSVLQCMSNTPPIVKYFLDGEYNHDLNEENPLGMRGEIARSFADLIKQMWSGAGNVSPVLFKSAVSKFAPQFVGFQQHDAQELLTFLLDGLHEDLNRITDKPYINLRDSDGRPDEEVAKEAWDNYLKRNDSIIVDLFHGQLKSTVVCPRCNMVSVTFDPFCYLSLPLPPKIDKEIEVVLYPYSHEKQPARHKVSLPNRGFSGPRCIADVFQALSEQTSYPPNQFIATEVVNHHFQKIFSAKDPIDLCIELKIYQVPYSVNDHNYVFVPVHLVVQDKARRHNPRTDFGDRPLFGVPFFVAVRREKCTYKKFYNELTRRLRYYVNMKAIGNNQDLSNGSSSASLYNFSNDDDRDIDEDPDEDEDVDDCDDDKDDAMNVDNPELEFAILINRSDGQSEMDTDMASDEGEDDSNIFNMYVADKDCRPFVPQGLDEYINFPEALGQQSILLVWTPKMKNLCYRDSLVDDIVRHPSCIARSKTVHLTDCLSLYTREEQLDANDAWYCPKCKDHIEASKKFDCWKLPRILVIHLKRFQYNRLRRDKIETLVSFPTTGLNLQKYVVDPNNKHGTVYDLIGVCNHYGSLVGGHYVAYGLNKEKNQWYSFDDSHVTPLSNESDVVTSYAYVLFYQRREEGAV